MANTSKRLMSPVGGAAAAAAAAAPQPAQTQPAPAQTQPAQPQAQPHPGQASRKLKLIGCCLLSNKQLEKHYKLHYLSDQELAAVGLQRSLLIDDYRLMHEISQMRQQDVKRDKTPKISLPSALPEDRAERIKELQLRLGIRPHKAYKFQLLNQLVRVMDTEPDPTVIFPEQQFNFFAIYCETEEVRRMSSGERERRRFDAFYDHLDSMFVNGDRNKAIDIVVDAFVRLKKRRMQVSQVPIPRGYMSPRSFDLIPRY